MVKSKSKNEPSFTDSSDALDEILEKFKAGNLPLEESLNLFEQGVGHLKTCQEKLVGARGEVEELVKTLQEGGEMVTRPLEE